MANTNTSYIKDPINGITYEKDLHLFDTEKVVHSKDDVKGIKRGLRKLNYKITGKNAFDENGNHKGFKCSAKCRPDLAEGHNRRDKNWVEKLEHVSKDGSYEIWMDYKNLDTVYKEIFGEALEEYNRDQRSNRRIKNYLTHVINDKRQGSMKKNANVDNRRKPLYEFIFQIGRRDNRLDNESSIKILKEFCLEWMPAHYPNISPIGIYLHVDEETKDAVTGKKLPGAVHVHFDYVPIAHALTKEEQEEDKKLKKEMEEKARKEAEEKDVAFNQKSFNSEWPLIRVKKFGKALEKGPKLQTSLTGACCEMGFRTKGKLTAQIQMEEAVRADLMNLAESYGIKIDRTIDTERDEVVSIQEYKKREDNKAVLKETQRLYKDAQSKLRQSQVLSEATAEKEEELAVREKNVSGLEEEKKAVKAEAAKVQKTKKEIAPYIERINTLEDDEENVQVRQAELDDQEQMQHFKEFNLTTREKELDKRAKTQEQKEKEADERIAFEKEKIQSEKEEVTSRSLALDERESALDSKAESIEADRIRNEEVAKVNEETAARNEKKAKEIAEKFDDFADKETKYKVYTSVINEKEEIKINVADIGRQLKSEMSSSEASWTDKVDYAVSNFTDRCQKVVAKLHHAISCFKNFLQGRTASEFRQLADDMDRNGTKTFDEYESRWENGSLDWQIESRQQRMNQRSIRRISDIER